MLVILFLVKNDFSHDIINDVDRNIHGGSYRRVYYNKRHVNNFQRTRVNNHLHASYTDSHKFNDYHNFTSNNVGNKTNVTRHLHPPSFGSF